MFDEIFLSPQVKRIVINSTEHDIYQLPHKLLYDLRLRNLGNEEISRRNISKEISQNFKELEPSALIFSILAKGSWKIETELFPYGAILHKSYSLSVIFLARIVVQEYANTLIVSQYNSNMLDTCKTFMLCDSV